MSRPSTSRNIYLNGTVELAREKGFDICQLKYDGWWCKAVCKPHQTEYYSETGRQFATSTPFPELVGCVLIGEYMRGTQWSQHVDRKGLFFVYDIWAAFDEPITNETYDYRYRLLRKLRLPSVYRLVDCYRTEDFEATWQRFVMSEGFEGVVFRRSKSTIEDAVVRCKREYTMEGTVIGFVEGQGKYKGTLGGIRVSQSSGCNTVVGGGFTDFERNTIWHAQTTYLGRIMEFTANAVFESGAPRHPRFIRWREDKL